MSRAPWSVCAANVQVSLHQLFPDQYPEDGVTIERPPQSRQEALETFFFTVLCGRLSREDAAGIVVLRNALDIQLRRGWFAKRESDGLWRVWEQYEREPPRLVCILSRPDPASALVVAEEWFEK